MSGPDASPLVLIVDDHHDTREMYSDYLTFEGMSVSTVATGAEALALVERERPDVVITDLHLVEMSGLDLTRAIKANPELASIPVVLLTGDGLDSVQQEAKEAGCATICLKPCLPDELARIIRELTAETPERSDRAAS